MTRQQDNLFLSKQLEEIFTKYYFAMKYFTFMLPKATEDTEDIHRIFSPNYGRSLKYGRKFLCLLMFIR